MFIYYLSGLAPDQVLTFRGSRLPRTRGPPPFNKGFPSIVRNPLLYNKSLVEGGPPQTRPLDKNRRRPTLVEKLATCRNEETSMGIFRCPLFRGPLMIRLYALI